MYLGEANRKYLEYYGVPKERLYPAIYCVDNQYFQTQYEKLYPFRESIRKSFGIFNHFPVILFCGRLVEMKCPFLLLDAFQLLVKEFPCYLLVVGDGPLRKKWKKKLQRIK
ncbi:glycosyltransferase [Candidatus Methylacidiphilum fumarolicum]|uniref:glycosyltransferase n=1 Tax=Candidatus Methylacidiphilum fumarolicum TaxID=591154 RepID=UPI002156101A|nr:glycosyltransferase [Candidatus Methylacidiphilum fumarolicum]